MPPAALPHMTSRQAKRLGKKTTGQFHFTASQLRRADRKEELDRRRREDQEKERRKKENKRKREEQAEEERATKRRLLREGKISLEETWGTVTASQPRLNTFFKKPGTAKRPRSAPVPDTTTHEDSGDGCDSQEETLVDPTLVLPRRNSLDEKDLQGISDQDLLQLASSQAHPTPPVSFEERPTSQSNRISTPSKMKRPRSPSPDLGVQNGRQDEDDELDSFPDFEVAEDDTAETLPINLNNFDPPASTRSALSEMSVANVNTRAQEKPDMTSAPADDSGLPSPPTKPKFTPALGDDALAMVGDADFSDDDLAWDKENTDPLDTPSKDKANRHDSATPKAKPKLSKKTATPGFSKFEDCEDIFDFDFDTGDHDDEFDDGVEDAAFMALSTQKPRSHIVNAYGSPKRVSSTTNKVVQPIVLEITPKKGMPAPAPAPATTSKCQVTRGKSSQAVRPSESFSSLPDEDLLLVAERVEQELSQQMLGKQKQHQRHREVLQPEDAESQQMNQTQSITEVDDQDFKKSNKRKLPWVTNPLPPPCTQDFLEELAEEVEAEMELGLELDGGDL